MKVVFEYVLIENLFVNLIILKTTSLVLQQNGRWYFFTSFLGGAFTAVLPLLRLSAFGHVLVQIGLATFFVCLSFKFKSFKKFLLIFASYFICAFGYGGVVYFVESLIGQNFMLIVLAIVVVSYIIFKSVYKILRRKKDISNFCYDVEIAFQNKAVNCKGFLDSGNLLFDPITQKPVCLINFKVFSQLFEGVEIEDVLRKNEKLKILKLAHYINFSTLNNTDKILVFEVDKLSTKNKTYENPVLGLSFKNFNRIFGTDLILHNTFV